MNQRKNRERETRDTIAWGNALADFPEHAQLIAQLISEWNIVEFHFANLLSLMLSAPAPIVSPMIFSIVNNRGRLDVIDAAILRLTSDDEEKGIIAGLLKEARAVLAIRNEYTHAIYVAHTTPKKTKLETVSMKNYHAGKPSMQAVSLGTLTKEVARVVQLAADIFAVFNARRGLVISPTSPLLGASTPPEPDSVYVHRLPRPRKPPRSSAK